MPVFLVLAALASFAASIGLPLCFPLPPAAHIHLAMAMGIMPLILGAMAHFVPVLTRSNSPSFGIQLIPLLLLATGAMTALSFAMAYQLYYLAAFLAVIATAFFFGWIIRRILNPLNKPHPCLHWYLAALACLMLALVAVVAMMLWPEQRLALKRLHLHLNTLGFVGLTAIATLQVLLPTAAGRFDPQAASRLRHDLKWALGGTLLVAVGAAWLKPLAWLGALLWAVPIFRLGKAWLTLYLHDIRQLHGAIPSLAAALAGFAISILFGTLHAGSLLSSTNTAHTFVLAFLLPLVTGAASQLLPVWRRPGPQIAWHVQTRQKLAWAGGVRGIFFLTGGFMIGMGWRNGIWLAIAALAIFLLQITLAASTTRK